MPKEDIEVEISDIAVNNPQTGAVVSGKVAVITDRKSQRAWSGEGETAGAAATEATRKFLGDRRSREYVGKD